MGISLQTLLKKPSHCVLCSFLLLSNFNLEYSTIVVTYSSEWCYAITPNIALLLYSDALLDSEFAFDFLLRFSHLSSLFSGSSGVEPLTGEKCKKKTPVYHNHQNSLPRFTTSRLRKTIYPLVYKRRNC